MHVLRYSILLLLIGVQGCDRMPDTEVGDCPGAPANAMVEINSLPIQGALLSTRFHSYEQLKSVIEVEFANGVRLTHCSNGQKVVSVLKPGVSEDDFAAARDEGLWQRLALIFKSPFAVAHRRDLQCVQSLARRRPDVFGFGDPAFYDLSEHVIGHIRATDTVLMQSQDLHSEKGYFNTVNHILAQAFMTSIFDEKVADLVADAHERKTMPELITGEFTAAQIADLENGPVDNYVDMINNEWGQELGKSLKMKYNLSRATIWTPQLLVKYLNDLQLYFNWAFHINLEPFRPEDNVVQLFATKMTLLLSDTTQ